MILAEEIARRAPLVQGTAGLAVLWLLREHACGLGVPSCLLDEGLPPTPEVVDWRRGEDAIELPELVAAWIENHPDRRGAGLYLTPRKAARELLRVATSDGFRPRSILDPAVGAGVFLEEALALFGPDLVLHGLDRDPVAVALTRLALWIAGATRDPRDLIRRIRCTDALLDPAVRSGSLQQGGFDLVCGNPPFGNAIERRTARSVQERRLLRGSFPETARGPYDRSVLFVQQAGRLLGPQGRFALLVPRALLAARYAEALRGWLAREAPMSCLLLYPNDAPVPECAIAMVGWIGSRAGGAVNVRVAAADGTLIHEVPRALAVPESWGALTDPLASRIEASARGHPTFAECFDVRASATVSEAYRLAGAVRDGGKDGWVFLTAGLIDRYGDRWGASSARFLGRKLLAPILARDADGLSRSRAALYDRAKIVVAGLSRTLKARCDAEGRCAGSVGTLAVIPRGDGQLAARLLRRGTMLLNSAWLSALHRVRRGPLALSGGSVPLGRRDIQEFPFPAPLLDEGVPVTARVIGCRRSAVSGCPLPRTPAELVGWLDAAAEVLLRNAAADPAEAESWDCLAQRVIFALAGWEEGEAEAIRSRWAGLLGGQAATRGHDRRRHSPPLDTSGE